MNLKEKSMLNSIMNVRKEKDWSAAKFSVRPPKIFLGTIIVKEEAMKKLRLIALVLTSFVFTIIKAQSYLTGDIGDMTLTADTEWIVLDLVWVEDGDTLPIEPGTIVKFTHGLYGYLAIKRGGIFIAEGTENNPITISSAEAKKCLVLK